MRPSNAVLPDADRHLRFALATAAAYLVLARASLLLTHADHGLALVWTPSGLFLAALLLSPNRTWPLTDALVLLANSAANLLAGNSLAVSAAFAIANVAEGVLAAAVALT